jgi:hypothetical protein
MGIAFKNLVREVVKIAPEQVPQNCGLWEEKGCEIFT